MDDKGEGIDRLFVDKNIHLDKFGLLISLELIVEGSISPGPGFEGVKEVINDLVERQFILEDRAGGLDVIGAQITAAALLAQLHNGTDKFSGDHDLRADDGFLHSQNGGGLGQVGGICQFHHGPVSLVDFVDDTRCCRDQVQIIFALQTLQNDFHVQKSQESAAETESQGQRCLGLEEERGIIELELFQGIAQVGIAGCLGRIQAAVDHGLCALIAGQGLIAGAGALCDSIADTGIADIFDRSGEISDHTCGELIAGDKLTGAEIADFDHFRDGTCRHHFDLCAAAEPAVPQAAEYNDTPVRIIQGVKDQGLERGIRIAVGRRYIGDDCLQDILHPQSLLGGNKGSFRGIQSDDILDLFPHRFRLGRGEVDLVNDRKDIQVVLQGQIDIGQGLGLDPLCRVHDQDRSVAGGKGAAHLIIKIHMSGCIDEIENIFLPVSGTIDQTDGLGLNRDTAFPLKIHVVEHLVLHLTAGEQTCLFNHAVRQRGFAVIDVGDNTEISDFILGNLFLHKYTFQSVKGHDLNAAASVQHAGFCVKPPADIKSVSAGGILLLLFTPLEDLAATCCFLIRFLSDRPKYGSG